MDARAKPPPQGGAKLTLYVDGTSVTAAAAIANLKALCGVVDSLREGDVEIVDIAARPEEAVRARIIATPTLIRHAPGPERRLVGDLSDHGRVLAALGLKLLR